IRDRNVTGVQTCALPIFRDHDRRPRQPHQPRALTLSATHGSCAPACVNAPARSGRPLPHVHTWCRRARHRPVRKRGSTPMAITVYSKPLCVQCDATKRALDKADLAYETVDITEDPEALAHVKSLGYVQAP